jgi:hypothetical protein
MPATGFFGSERCSEIHIEWNLEIRIVFFFLQAYK